MEAQQWPGNRVVSDREGGFVAIDPIVRAGRMVVVIDGISPPLLTRYDRRMRRIGFRRLMQLNAWLLGCEAVAWLAAWWWSM